MMVNIILLALLIYENYITLRIVFKCVSQLNLLFTELSLVSRLGFEPRTKSLKGSCSTTELPTLGNHYIKDLVLLTRETKLNKLKSLLNLKKEGGENVYDTRYWSNTP